ncbi:hypothetical protein LPC08_06065 [Roseomonas sp. OT10]|uniref:hypothetical protein n=1 Tax=Roseomonas cutis TaxID=2897332 RepID=UPI001E54ED50|nr:hypothetical protein [Roseomonas sp. OT10]UFN50188.1 hypothetical protein LPC08_06065 [Roseomonas sp. OT10]
MGIPLAGELGLLSENEREPILRSHYPLLDGLPQEEVLELARWLRQQRNRNRDLISGRRRARRGKADARSPGAEAASERGLAAKKQVFAQALKRVNARLDTLNGLKRRERNNARLRAALARRQGQEAAHPESGQTANPGLAPRKDRGIRVRVDPREVGRVSQFVRDAQARRDRRRAQA